MGVEHIGVVALQIVDLGQHARPAAYAGPRSTTGCRTIVRWAASVPVQRQGPPHRVALRTRVYPPPSNAPRRTVAR
jgi:hypothetical protein